MIANMTLPFAQPSDCVVCSKSSTLHRMQLWAQITVNVWTGNQPDTMKTNLQQAVTQHRRRVWESSCVYSDAWENIDAVCDNLGVPTVTHDTALTQGATI